MSNQREWCEHMDKYTKSLKHPTLFTWDMQPFKFCPLCAAPRPSEPKTLAEKFREHIGKAVYGTILDEVEPLAKIAEQHFLSQLEGKEVEEELAERIDTFYVVKPVKECVKEVLQFIKERIS